MKISSFESLATVDGEGVRFGVFLAGCPLRCVCCHNPETWTGGTDISPESLVAKAARFKPYFGQNGGVTFSGGEPLLQATELLQVAQLLKEKNIGYAIDTSGCVALSDDVKQLLVGADLVICDLKYHNSTDFKKYTGGKFEDELATLEFLKSTDTRVWLRTVIIPDINDTQEDISAYAEIVNRFPNVESWKLLPFHTLGFDKYKRLGIPNPLQDTSPMNMEKLEELQVIQRKLFDGDI